MSDSNEEAQTLLVESCFAAVEKRVKRELEKADLDDDVVSLEAARLMLHWIDLVTDRPSHNDELLEGMGKIMTDIMTGEASRQLDEQSRPIQFTNELRPSIAEHRYVRPEDAVINRKVDGGYVVKVFGEVESRRMWPAIQAREMPSFLDRYGMTKERSVLALVLVYGPDFDEMEENDGD
jgi:hypothetical protein